jgi:hypothetical protein
MAKLLAPRKCENEQLSIHLSSSFSTFPTHSKSFMVMRPAGCSRYCQYTHTTIVVVVVSENTHCCETLAKIHFLTILDAFFVVDKDAESVQNVLRHALDLDIEENVARER